MATDPLFGNTLLEAGTAQAEVLVNEIVGRISAGGFLVKSFGDNTPPGSPANFDAYVIGSSGTGDWNTFDNQIAVYLDGWKFHTPVEGNRVRVADTDVVIEYGDTEWTCVRGDQSLADGANITWDCALGNTARVTLAGNRTLDNPTNARDGVFYAIRVAQDSSGSRTLAFGSLYDFQSATPPTMSGGLGDVDVISFVRINGRMIMISFVTSVA